ncbi:MAG: peptidoglycan-associated lipoprotein Pal [Desulfobulbus sp.]|jgi:peptidoglycan-associated lipoprotein
MRSRTITHWVLLLLLAVSVGLVGCSKKTTVTAAGEGTEDDGGMGVATESLDTPSTTEAGNILEGRTSGPMLPVYFDFDANSIRSDQVPRIEGNASYLRENPNMYVRIEGNCDPRGTQEYNLALGERRAQTAKSYLINLGVNPDRLSTVSFGEEKLLFFGQDEASWAQNRRADFVIVK